MQIFKTHKNVRAVNDVRTARIRKKLMATRLMPCLTSLTLMSFVGISLVMNTAQAACDHHGCACVPTQLQFAAPEFAPDEDGAYPISLEADSIDAQGEQLIELTGNADVSQGRNRIVADRLQYFRDAERAIATGNVEIVSERGDYLVADSADVHVPTQIGTVQNAEFKMASASSNEDGVDTVDIGARGSASVVDLEGEGLMRLHKAHYSTCPEGNNDVLVNAKELVLDHISGVGKARNATVRFKGIPVLYAPYITFPINDERKTGFLIPSFGNDQESGNIIEIPWYWNIAKNQDATITPRYFTDRGVQLAAEYRHQSVNSLTYLYGEILPDDNIFGETRDLLTIQHQQQFTNNLSASINYNDVSDIDYFDDLRNTTQYFSATFVPRNGELNYSNRYLRVRTRVNEFQIIDDVISPSNAPYERLPSITLSTSLPDGPWGLEYGLDASYTDFASPTRVEGTRLALTPYAELPFESIWGFFTPRIAIYNRSYRLDDLPDEQEDRPSFTVPVVSFDAGIFLEKNINWFGQNAIQTLEPRIYYVYAPSDEDQDLAPVFDTRLAQLNNFQNIFRENRFFGEDRVGDTNQVTFGLTSRVIDNESGDERLTFSIGQLYLFDDLEQAISADAVGQESGLGDLLLELTTRAKKAWSTRAFIQYDHDESEIVTAAFSVAYQPKSDNRKNISLGYRFSRGSSRDIDQLTTNISWPLTDRWQVFASNRYSIEDSESLFSNVGVEYDACCWKLRVSAQDRISNRNIDDKRAAVFVELELTSLGTLRTGS